MFDDLDDEPLELEPIDKGAESDEDDDIEVAKELRKKPSKKYTVSEVRPLFSIVIAVYCVLR